MNLQALLLAVSHQLDQVQSLHVNQRGCQVSSRIRSPLANQQQHHQINPLCSQLRDRHDDLYRIRLRDRVSNRRALQAPSRLGSHRLYQVNNRPNIRQVNRLLSPHIDLRVNHLHFLLFSQVHIQRRNRQRNHPIIQRQSLPSTQHQNQVRCRQSFQLL